MNIQGFRSVVNAALAQTGLHPQRLATTRQNVWSLPAEDLLRFFQPHTYRRPWGFVLGGTIGIEIPALRKWLDQHKPGDAGGILRSYFTGYLIVNEEGLSDFMVEHGAPVSCERWASLISERVSRIPPNVDELLQTYFNDREALGWLAQPYSKPAWDFLKRWHADFDPSLAVPCTTPTR